MLENPFYYDEEEANDRRRTILPLAVWAIVVGLILGATLYASRCYAEPLFQVQNKDITITLFDYPCELKEQIANLPYKATWQEGGKTFQGCFGPRPDVGMVMFYFDDRTVGLIPFDVLKKVVGV